MLHFIQSTFSLNVLSKHGGLTISHLFYTTLDKARSFFIEKSGISCSQTKILALLISRS